MGGLQRHPVEREIGEAREHLRLRLAVEIAPACLGIVGGGRGSHQHVRPPATDRRLALVDHDRDARVRENVLGVDGKARDQQEGAIGAVATFTSEQ